ncbi:MAG: hypothetical protein ACK44W_05135 [Planctomycetota bacterium]
MRVRLHPRIRLSDLLSETRILAESAPIPGRRAVLRLAELMVRDGAIRNPLGFYNEALNQEKSAVIVPKPEGDRPCSFRVYQVCSPAVGRLSAALGLSPKGFPFEDGTAELLLLLASPTRTLPACLAAMNRALQIVRHPRRAERILSCIRPEEVLALVREFDRRT